MSLDTIHLQHALVLAGILYVCFICMNLIGHGGVIYDVRM